MKNEAVSIKGTPKEILMIFNESMPIMEILEALRVKVKESNGFFKGSFNIRVSGREFSKSDVLRITSVLKTILPEATVYFDKF